MGSTLGSWSQDLDMTMVGTLYCTYMTSWVGSTAAMTSQRGFMREEVVNFRSAAQPAVAAVSRQPLWVVGKQAEAALRCEQSRRGYCLAVRFQKKLLWLWGCQWYWHGTQLTASQECLQTLFAWRNKQRRCHIRKLHPAILTCSTEDNSKELHQPFCYAGMEQCKKCRTSKDHRPQHNITKMATYSKEHVGLTQLCNQL